MARHLRRSSHPSAKARPAKTSRADYVVALRRPRAWLVELALVVPMAAAIYVLSHVVLHSEPVWPSAFLPVASSIAAEAQRAANVRSPPRARLAGRRGFLIVTGRA